jgi:hypothetical protein
MDDLVTPRSGDGRRFSFVGWIMGIVGTVIATVAVVVITDWIKSTPAEKPGTTEKPAEIKPTISPRAVNTPAKGGSPKRQAATPDRGNDKKIHDEKHAIETNDDD